MRNLVMFLSIWQHRNLLDFHTSKKFLLVVHLSFFYTLPRRVGLLFSLECLVFFSEFLFYNCMAEMQSWVSFFLFMLL